MKVHDKHNSISRLDSFETKERLVWSVKCVYTIKGIEMATSSIRLNNQEVIQKYKTKELNQQQLGSYSYLFYVCPVSAAPRLKLILVNLLKQLNALIDAGSKLRIGAPSSDVLSVCRKAVKTRKPDVIANAILHGIQ